MTRIDYACMHVQDISPYFWERGVSYLSEEEQAYAAHFTDSFMHHQWLAGRILLRCLLAHRLCCTLQNVRIIRLLSGQLQVIAPGTDIHISLSRAHGMLAVAVGTGVRVGIDIAAVKDFMQDSHMFPFSVDVWCGREAVAKGCGRGLDWALETECYGADGQYRDDTANVWSVASLPLPTGWFGRLAFPMNQSPDTSIYAVCPRDITHLV